MDINKNKSISNHNDAKKVFRKLGTCSRTFIYLLNREFGHLNEDAERAADPLSGGIMRRGHQCGMLWGSALAAGAESFRRFGNSEKAISAAVSATQSLMDSFKDRTSTIQCREITDCNFMSNLSMAKYLITGRFLGCFRLAEKWAPEAIESALEGLSIETDVPSYTPVSCATEIVKKLGGSEEEAIQVAGFAGGLGLSGNACGGLAAAIWMKTLAWCRKHPEKSAYNNPDAEEAFEAFMAASDSEIRCDKITGQCFKSLDEHTQFIQCGGCNQFIDILSQASSSMKNETLWHVSTK